MTPSLSVYELCAKYRCDGAHGRHVASLAVRLYDALRQELTLPRAFRRLLETASLLHDIGFSVNPGRHEAAGARIVAGEGVKGFDRRQCEIMARAVGMHRGPGAKGRVSGAASREQTVARRIAAILKIADGLDHGHVQNADIHTVVVAVKKIRVLVHSPGYARNIDTANMKAGLFNRVFAPYRLEIADAGVPDMQERFACAVKKNDTVLDAARRLLMLQYCTVRDNRAGAVKGDDPECLHDMRTALRRSRAALRLFRKPLGRERVEELDEKILRLAEKLGQARDLDVWLQYLSRPDVDGPCSAHQSWKRYVKEQVRERRRCQAGLASVLRSRVYADCAQSMCVFLRVEVPDRARTRQALLRPFAARKLKRAYRTLARCGLALPEQPGDVHRFRKKYRRARYVAEFFAPVLGAATGKQAAHLKQIAVVLGALHDSDIGLERIRRGRSEAMRELRRILMCQRARLAVESQALLDAFPLK